MLEVAKEWKGTLEFLDSTVPFLQDLCPIFDDCSFLLSLGSGEVPRSTPQQSWWDWVWGVNAPSPHPPLLRAHVAALPEDKRIMFERAAGKLWDPKFSEDHEDGIDHSQSMLLEDLIGSRQLPTQTKFPDNSVPSVSGISVSLKVRYSL
jgi:hypothetical protein